MKVQCDGGCGAVLAKAHRGSASGHYCEAPDCGQARRTDYARRRFQTDPVYHAWQTDYEVWRYRQRRGWPPERLGARPHIGDYRAAAQQQAPLPRVPRLRVAPAAVTHCPRGHEYTPENTAVYKGSRHCRTCHRMRQALRNHGMKGSLLSQ